MSEAESSPEMQPQIEKITHGECVVYATNIRPNSEWTSMQSEAQQLRALAEISKKAKASKEKIIGTALLSTATDEDWPITRLRSTLIVIGSSPVAHPREPLSKEDQRFYQTQTSDDVLMGSTMLAPEWKNLYKGTISKDILMPVAHFADEAIQKLGKNINISVSLPNLGAWTAYMMATKRPSPEPANWMLHIKNPAK